MTIQGNLFNTSATNSFEKLKERLQFLRSEIEHHNKLYYQLDKPEISDAEYDKLFSEMVAIEKNYPILFDENSPSQRVGCPPLEKFKKIKHTIPMLSLGNIFTLQDLEDFCSKIKKELMVLELPELLCELKYDGVSFSAVYENGVFKYASTRGDGYVGEDISANIRTIRSLPLKLNTNDPPNFLEIRGEVLIYKKDFELLNEIRKQENLETFLNPRNAASGSLRQLHSSIAAKRKLKYFVYSIAEIKGKTIASQLEALNYLDEAGFCVNNKLSLTNDINKIQEFYNSIFESRSSLDYEIDGLVLKINSFDLQKQIGYISRSPKFAIAYKFPSEISKTKILSVTWQVGRTGTITPVAELEPINIGGVYVSRCTLHNKDEISRLGIMVGDEVFIKRSGDVIPKIESVDLNFRQHSDTQEILIPVLCPICNTKLIKEEKEVALKCPNKYLCKAQIIGNLIHFCSRNAMNIEGLGEQQIEFLYSHEFISNQYEIFLLEEKNYSCKKKIQGFHGWGEKSYKNLIESIKRSKDTTLQKFIFSLGIKHIGLNSAQILSSHYKSPDRFLSALHDLTQELNTEESELTKLNNIGPKMILSLKEFAQEAFNLKLVKNLLSVLNVSCETFQETQNKKTIVFTGSLKHYSRKEAQELSHNHGFLTSDTITKSVDYLISGDKSGSKIEKAQKLGVKVLSEEGWLELLGNKNE